MNKYFLLAFCLLVPQAGISQIDTTGTPAKKRYWMSASEFIFSGSSVEAYGGPLVTEEIDVNPIVRFTCFFHFQEQLHYDFNDNIGIFTGIGLRNVGMINDLNDSVKVKQRAYSLGIPVAFKFGKLPDGFFAAVGAEAELFFHYKQKVFDDDEKFKHNEWFSDKVNLFNPSVFLDINSGRGAYLRFKYYLLDFLTEDDQEIKWYGVEYPYYPTSSKLFYIAIGTSLKSFTSKASKKAKESLNSAFLY
jgi:hypothetical protein